MKKWTCIIVDDDREAAEGIYLMLEDYASVDVLAIIDNGLEAIGSIEKNKPDLLFLDVQMPSINGFEVLRSTKYQPEVVIFVTAFDRYALKAFEVRALDYLLKPFTDDRFSECMERSLEHLSRGNDQSSELKELLDHQLENTDLRNKEGWTKKDDELIIKTGGIVQILSLDKIIRIEGFDYYIKIVSQSKTFVIRESLKTMENVLSNAFIRIHRSTIVNIDEISEVNLKNARESSLTLSDGTVQNISRTYVSRVKEIFHDI